MVLLNVLGLEAGVLDEEVANDADAGVETVCSVADVCDDVALPPSTVERDGSALPLNSMVLFSRCDIGDESV